MRIAARPPIPVLLAASVFAALLLCTGCKREENRPAYQPQVESRAKAVEQAERNRQAAQQQAQREAARDTSAQRAPASSAPSSATATTAATAPPAAGYMPPSEDGADVQITETPLDGSPASQSANVPAPGSLSVPQAPSSGGQMPSDRVVTPVPGGPPPGAGPTGGAGMRAPTTAPDAAALSATAARTGVEQANALNQELQRKLREFDALMQKAHENAARERAATATRGGTSNSNAMRGDGGSLEEPPENIGAGGAANRGTGLGHTPDISGESPGARPSLSSRAEIELPGGADDDIVSRQLREAAQRETDPVLREKLWEEYRNYTGDP